MNLFGMACQSRPRIYKAPFSGSKTDSSFDAQQSPTVPLTYAHNFLYSRLSTEKDFVKLKRGELDQSSDQRCRIRVFIRQSRSHRRRSPGKFSCCPLIYAQRRALGAIDLNVKYSMAMINQIELSCIYPVSTNVYPTAMQVIDLPNQL